MRMIDHPTRMSWCDHAKLSDEWRAQSRELNEGPAAHPDGLVTQERIGEPRLSDEEDRAQDQRTKPAIPAVIVTATAARNGHDVAGTGNAPPTKAANVLTAKAPRAK